MVEYLLKESFKKNLCPICLTVEIEMDEFFFWFEREGYHEYSSIKALFEHSCICKKHREQILGLKEKLNNTFELLAEMEIKELNGLVETKRFKRKVREINRDCRFCIEEKRIEKHAVETLCKSKELVESYINSPSIFCKKHTFMVLESIDNPELAQTILKKAISYLENVHERIEKYFNKIDYRSSEKPTREEQNAYLNAVKFFSNL